MSSDASLDRSAVPAARPTPPHALIALVLIVAAAALVRWYYFSGYQGIDDAEYARFAYLLAHGRPFPADYSGPSVFPLRVGAYVPTAVLFALFGSNEWTMVLYPFIVSVAAIVLVYFGASMFFGWRAGLIAAALLAFFYLDINNSTKLLPDLPAAFFAAVGVLIIVAMQRQPIHRPPSLLWTGVLAGLSFGLSWLCKESIAYLVPFCLGLILIDLKNGTKMVPLWIGVTTGALSILTAEMTVYQFTTGDLLFRVHEVERNYRQWENGFFTAGSNSGWRPGTSYRDALIDRLLVSGPRKILFDPTLYFMPLIGLVGTLYGWVRRERSFLIPGLWLWTLVFIFNFGSSSLTSYTPLALFYRYMYLLFVPAVILVSGLLAHALASESSSKGGASVLIARGGALAAVLLIAWTAAHQLYYAAPNRTTWLTEVRALHEMVAADTPVFADPLTLRGFEFFAGYPEQTAWTDLQRVRQPSDIPARSLVVVNRRYISWLDTNAGMWVRWPAPGRTNRSGYHVDPAFADSPPGSTELLNNGNVHAYRIEQRATRAAPSSTPQRRAGR